MKQHSPENKPIITGRPCTEADLAFLYEVYTSTREEEMAMVPWDDEQKEAFLRMQFHAQHTYYHAQFPGASYSIIEAGGVAAGRLYINRSEDEILIIDIALLPRYRRQGIGTGLLREILREGAEAAKPVRIHVEKFNPALRLYERLGFLPVGDNGVYLLMEWKS
jgi:ribosomal protein S18 acetylase RimI-like enzyme